jgi:uncharacterized membrane protein YccC
MSIRALLMMSALALPVAFGAGAASADATLKSPKKVEKSLATFNRVVDHTARLITAKNYTHLLHENDELKEGAEALEKSIAKEPDDFKAKVQPLLEKAEADSQALADAAKAKDDDKLASAHTALAASVNDLVAAFPAAAQPPAAPKAKETKEDGAQK